MLWIYGKTETKGVVLSGVGRNTDNTISAHGKEISLANLLRKGHKKRTSHPAPKAGFETHRAECDMAARHGGGSFAAAVNQTKATRQACAAQAYNDRRYADIRQFLTARAEMAPRTLAELFSVPEPKSREDIAIREAWEKTPEGKAWRASADAYHARMRAAESLATTKPRPLRKRTLRLLRAIFARGQPAQ